MLPLDHPTASRAHRVYFALTNHCNRACPWCSTCSSPAGQTFLSLADFHARLPKTGRFEVQLEGGEPTVHPSFWQFVAAARAEPRCERLVLCSNGVVMPRQRHRLRTWLQRLGAPLTLKLSFNHHLVERDAGLLALAVLARELCAELGNLFVLNLRVRPGRDAAVVAAVEAAGLSTAANVFELQAYGFARDEAWSAPFVVGENFTLINPDGSVAGTNLVARSEAMRGVAMTAFVPAWRRDKSVAFDLFGNSTAKRTVMVDFWGTERPVYGNANFSIYSAQTCNARCAFCVEELRPASRGRALAQQKHIEGNDDVYFAALEASLECLKALRPSTSITGGEPSKDPRLPRMLATLAKWRTRQRTLTTNASGLLDLHCGRRLVEHFADHGLQHLNISRAHPDPERNAQLMSYREGLSFTALREAITVAQAGGTEVRLSCVLVRGAVDSVAGIARYLDFAASLGVQRVIFRRLMQTDPTTVERNSVVRFSDGYRVALEPLLDALDQRFTFVKQIVGYYYYVEVFRCSGMSVVFEEADLGQLERAKRRAPEIVHELIFHPSAALGASWQPWDQVLGPRPQY